MISFRLSLTCLLCYVAVTSLAQADTIIPVHENVMTSAFFQGANTVRGYAQDARPVLRVGTDNAFGNGPETIYLAFQYDFVGLTEPITRALLTIQTADGGFGANASPESPFTISAHQVSADPLTSIIDDTNPNGTIPWRTFFESNILPADDSAQASVMTTDGPISIDVTRIVNDWISGQQSIHTMAITGKNHVAGGDFLHGFVNNWSTPGSTYLTLVTVPEPTSSLILLTTAFLFAHRRLRSAILRNQSHA